MGKFKLGKMTVTRGVADRMKADKAFAAFVSRSIRRYMECDWGDTCKEDAKQNDEAVRNGDDRILASFVKGGRDPYKIWIITEWDHSATTVLFPEEY